MTAEKYLKVCPRGFANEVTYLKVSPEETADAESFAADYSDRMGPNGYAEWSADQHATRLGVAVDWADRNMVI